ncbi:hypothetical protein H632_c70p0, partial [Helicosporidium sp. ATCC 50920]
MHFGCKRAVCEVLCRAEQSPLDGLSHDTEEPSTGLQMVDDFCLSCDMVETLRRTAHLLALSTAGAAAAGACLWLLERLADQRTAACRGPRAPLSQQRLVRDVLRALFAPHRALVPAYWALSFASISVASAQVVAGHAWPELLATGPGRAALRAARKLTWGLQASSGVVVVAWWTWSALELKRRVVGHLERSIRSAELRRLVSPASVLFNWVAGGLGLAAALSCFGFDVRPLLTSLGASSIFLGIAAQGLLKNLSAAVTMYTSHVFVVGDTVQLLTTSGASVVEGVVEAVEPWRTTIRVADGSPVFVANSDVIQFLI